MNVAVVSGSTGLVGAEAVRFFSKKGFKTVGIDKTMKQSLSVGRLSADWIRHGHCATIPGYQHYDVDLRDRMAIDRIFDEYSSDIKIIIHASTPWLQNCDLRDPELEFTLNANGTLSLLEATRNFAPDASFIFSSTNKVYGKHPRSLPLIELDTRWEIDRSHHFYQHGIDESLPVDLTQHFMSGVSTLTADLLVQEYGQTFGLNTAVFRGSGLISPLYSERGTDQLLSQIVQCAMTNKPFVVSEGQRKQVRDELHAFDLLNMFWHYHLKPRPGEAYNAGGGRQNNYSVAEAIVICEKIDNCNLAVIRNQQSRNDDQLWWISDTRKFEEHYPDWSQTYTVGRLVQEIFATMRQKVDSTLQRAA